MTQTQIKKRSNAIDMVKGLSIMTLFFLHFENGWQTTDYNFFIVRSPAFYIIVGWLWGLSKNRRSVREHWEKRLQGLVKPYFYFSLIFIAFDLIMVICQQFEQITLYRDIYKTICLKGIGTLWFLPALLGGEIMFLYLRTKKMSIKLSAIIFVLILLYALWGGINLENETFSNIANAPISTLKNMCLAFIFISIAYFISRTWGKKILAINKTRLFFIGAALLSADFYIMNFHHLTGVFSYILNSMLAGIGILLLFTAVEDFKPLSRPLVYCGKNSLIIMAVHFNLLFQLALIFDKVVLEYESYYGSRTLIYFIVAVILQILVIEFINKKVPFIIGK